MPSALGDCPTALCPRAGIVGTWSPLVVPSSAIPFILLTSLPPGNDTYLRVRQTFGNEARPPCPISISRPTGPISDKVTLIVLESSGHCPKPSHVHRIRRDLTDSPDKKFAEVFLPPLSVYYSRRPLLPSPSSQNLPHPRTAVKPTNHGVSRTLSTPKITSSRFPPDGSNFTVGQ